MERVLKMHLWRFLKIWLSKCLNSVSLEFVFETGEITGLTRFLMLFLLCL